MQEQIKLVREEPQVQDTIRPNERTATSFAMAVSSALGMPEQEGQIRDLYMATGSQGKWEQAKHLYNQLSNETARQQVVKNVITKAQIMGLDPAATLQGGEVLKEEAAVARHNLELTKASPEASAYVHSLLTTPREPAIDDEDQEQREKWPKEAHLERHYAEAEEREAEIQAILAEKASDGFAAGSWMEAGAGMLGYFTPIETALANEVYFRMRDLFENYHPALTGQITSTMEEYYGMLPPAEQRVFEERLIQTIQDSPTGFFDFINQGLFDQIVNPESRLGATEENEFNHILSNVGSVFDIFMLGGFFKFIKAGLRSSATPAAKITLQVDKETATNQLAEIVADPTSPIATGWGVSREQVVRTQLPGYGKMDDIIEDVPEELLEEAERIAILREQTGELLDRTRGAALTPVDRINAVEREARQIEQAQGGKLRVGMSRITMHEGGHGVRYTAVLGKNEKYGFRSERTAFEEAEDLIAQGFRVRIKISDNKQLHGYLTGEEAMEDLALIRQANSGRKSQRGNFYVEYDFDYKFRATDKGLFGDNPVTSPEFLGRSARTLQTPSAQFSREVYEPFLFNQNAEQALTSKLDSIVAPIFRMSNSSRRTIDDMYSYTEDFARKNGRAPTQSDYTRSFPDAGPDEFKGIFLARKYYDTIYDIQNERLYRDWNGRGFVTIRDKTGSTAYHGKPLNNAELGQKYEGGLLSVLEPSTGKILRLSRKEVDELYTSRGSILETELPITVDKNTRSTLVLSDPNQKAWELTPLSQYPLKYIEGYFPRVYQDKYFIRKVMPNAIVNGAVKQHTQVVSVAGTREEAEKFARRMKEQDSANDYVIADQNMTVKDRVAADLEQLQVEGRLFFDERQQKQLYNVQRNKADIVSPTNMMQRTSRMVARQVSMEDLVKEYKTGWDAMYGDMVPGIDRTRSSGVRGALNNIIESGTKEEKARAVKAHQMWDYISLMEGNIAGSSQWFRQRAVVSAEWLHEKLSKVPGVSRVTTWGNRNASKISPIENMKHLAFIDFIVTRPFRQLLLQGAQHFFLGALDPLYMGKWQTDSFLLLQGQKKQAAYLAGGRKVSKKMAQRNAKLMGVTPEEYAIMLKELDLAGNVQSVNVHSLAGDTVALRTTPESVMGDVVQKVGRTLTGAPVRAGLQKYGFDLGEQYNITASWLMAKRRYMKENNIESIAAMTKDDWRAVAVKGSDYGMAMNRANSASFQYGVFSLPTQFLQFTHKTFLTMLRGGVPVPFADKIPGIKNIDKAMSSAGNKGFTREEARKILVGQAVLFGGAGFGFKPEVERLLLEAGFDQYIGTEGVDLIAGGLLDYAVDTALQRALDDPDLDLMVGEFLAPGANILNTMRHFVEMGTELPVSEAFFGAFGATATRFGESFKMGRFIINNDPDMPMLDKVGISMDYIARGGLSGYNDFVKARYAYNSGKWLSSDGRDSDLEAKTAEVWARGLLGLRSEHQNTSWRLWESAKDRDTMIKDTAREYANQTNTYIKEWVDGNDTLEGMRNKILGAKTMLQVALDPEDYTQAMEEYNRIQGSYEDQRRSASYMIAKGMSEGKTTEEYLFDLVKQMPGTDQDRQALEVLLREQIRDVDFASEETQESLQRQIDIIERARNK